MAMEIRYRTKMADYVAFCRHHYRHSRTALINLLLGWLLLPLGGLLYVWYRLSQDGWNSTLVGWLGASLGYLVIYPFLHRFLLDIYVRSHVSEHGTRGVIGEIQLILTEVGLVEVTETMRSEVAWGNVHRIVDSGEYMFIYFTPVAAAILPKHGFESEEQYEHVKDYAKKCFSRSREQVALRR